MGLIVECEPAVWDSFSLEKSTDIVCINDSGQESEITKGKTYIAIKIDGDMVTIINDRGNTSNFYKVRFRKGSEVIRVYEDGENPIEIENRELKKKIEHLEQEVEKLKTENVLLRRIKTLEKVLKDIRNRA